MIQRKNMESPAARYRLLLALVVILSFSFVGTGLINYTLTRDTIHQEILVKGLPLTRDNIYSDLTAGLARPILVASSMATDTFLKDWASHGEKETDRIRRYLEKIHERYGFFSTFFVSATTGNYYHYKGLHKVVSRADKHDIWFYKFIDSSKEYDLDVDTDEADSNVLTVFINYRVVDEKGKLLGVTGVGLKVDSLAGMIVQYQKKYDRSIYLVSKEGIIQVHQNHDYIDRVNIAELEGIGKLAKQILDTGDEPHNFQFERDGEDILLTVRYIPQLDWVLCVEQNETVALSAARQNVIRTVGVGLAATAFVLLLTMITLNRYQKKVEEMATTDFLTGVANRRVLEVEYRKLISRQSRMNRPFSVILIDLDGFKNVNDTLGHLTGDEMLKKVASLIEQTVRPTDIVARWGGDEFVIVTEVGASEAAVLGERIRQNVVEMDFCGQRGVKDDPRNLVTVSCGVSEYEQGDSLDRMLLRADKALYLCKDRGKNMVLVQQSEG